MGVESCDGTGWFRGDQNQLAGLKKYLAQSSGKERRPDNVDMFAPNLDGICSKSHLEIARIVGPEDER
jgi:hypothetical protein